MKYNLVVLSKENIYVYSIYPPLVYFPASDVYPPATEWLFIIRGKKYLSPNIYGSTSFKNHFSLKIESIFPMLRLYFIYLYTYVYMIYFYRSLIQ